ncbi:MAG: DeoR family transcriptional regulator, partial [Pseudomonadota bacterium]
DARETETAKVIFRNAERTLLVADHSKFGRRAMIRFGSFADIDALYTDISPEEPYASAIGDQGTEVFVSTGD